MEAPDREVIVQNAFGMALLAFFPPSGIALEPDGAQRKREIQPCRVFGGFELVDGPLHLGEEMISDDLRLFHLVRGASPDIHQPAFPVATECFSGGHGFFHVLPDRIA